MTTPFVAPLFLAAAEGGGGGLLSVESTLLWATLVIFALFASVLGKFAWGPLLKIVDEREKSIRDQVDSAERSAAEARQLLAQHQELVKSAGRERDELLARAAKEAETIRQELLARARADAEQVLSRELGSRCSRRRTRRSPSCASRWPTSPWRPPRGS